MQIKARCEFYQENIWKFLARHSTHKWHTICKPKLTIEDLLCKFPVHGKNVYENKRKIYGNFVSLTLYNNWKENFRLSVADSEEFSKLRNEAEWMLKR